jgi:hypothetical protein
MMAPNSAGAYAAAITVIVQIMIARHLIPMTAQCLEISGGYLLQL